MFTRMISKGNDSFLVYNTKLDLRMVYMACPWAETMYHICDEKLHERFCALECEIHPFAMSCGDKYVLFDATNQDGIHHYYFRLKGGAANATV